MAIIIGADAAGSKLKDVVKDFLVGENFEVVDVTKEGQDFVDVTLAVAAEVNKQEENLGINFQFFLSIFRHLVCDNSCNLRQRTDRGKIFLANLRRINQ